MTTMMEAPFLSNAATHAPSLTDTHTSNMADTLPSINFGFDQLRDRMARFTDRFDAFIADGRRRVLEERNQFHTNLAEAREEQKLKEKSLDLLAQKHAQNDLAQQQQDAETAEIQHEIADLRTQRDEASTRRNELSNRITRLKTEITSRQSAQSAHARDLDSQSCLNLPELEFWETYLGLRIEGVGMTDRLRFVFTNLDEKQPERSAWFELDTRKPEYDVVDWTPRSLEKAKVDECVAGLNTSRDLAAFLKRMREDFKTAMLL